MITTIRILAVIILLLLAHGFIYSQKIIELSDLHRYEPLADSLGSGNSKNIKNYEWYNAITNLHNDFYAFGDASIQSENLSVLLGVGAVTGTLVLVDENMFRRTKETIHSIPFLKNTTDITVHIGDGKTTLALAAGLSVYGLLSDESKYVNTSVKIIESL